MPDTVVTTLISAAATVVGAAIPVVYKAVSGRGRLYSSQKLSFIEGTWTGGGGDFFIEDDVQPRSHFNCLCLFKGAAGR